MTDRAAPPSAARGAGAGTWAAAVLYAAASAVFLAPLLSASASVAIGDLLGHAWGLAWVDRQLWRDPLHLYDANIYYPEAHSLRHTESLVPQALLVGPFAALGADPLLLVNAATIETFALAALGAYLLARHLTGSFVGALFAGLAYAFTTYRWNHLVHVGVLSTEWFPLLVLLTLRQLEGPRRRWVLLLAATLWCQALSSGYYAYPAFGLAAITALLAGPPLWSRRGLAGIAAALVAAAIALYPFARPYLELAAAGERWPESATVSWSARPASYLCPGAPAGEALPHLALLEAWTPEREPLFPGTAVLLLAGAGLALRPRLPWAGRMAAIGAVALLLSLGPWVSIGGLEVAGPYQLLRLLPLGGMMRVPARLGVVVQLCLAILSAFGLDALCRRGRRVGALAAVAALALWAVEAYPYGVAAQVRTVRRDPAFARWLARADPGPVLELPYRGENGDGLYVYWSTKHWLPLVNGHGTFPARRASALAVLGNAWPMPRSLEALRAAGVRYVVVHRDALTLARRERLERLGTPHGVELAFQDGPDQIYRIAIKGFPVSAELRGRVPEEALAPGFLAAHPIRRVAGYGPRTPLDPGRLVPAVDAELMERLRALGYIE